ncbi:cytochrome c oxidase copper chaperone, partial [Gautieria morchelliformis]
PAVNPLNPEGLKPCCACPETKSNRDECFLSHDPDAADDACRDLVRKHVECMRGYGFKI